MTDSMNTIDRIPGRRATPHFQQYNLPTGFDSDQTPGKWTRPTQASGLVTLPQELQDIIFSNVSREDRLRLYRTCQVLRNTALPFLAQDLREITFTTKPNPVKRMWQDVLESELRESYGLRELIKTLRLHSMDPSARHTPWAFTSSSLTTLEHDFFIDGSQRSDHPCLDTRQLASNLYCHKDTLTHLKISYEVSDHFDDQHDKQYTRGQCSLRTLLQLKTLTIPLAVLLGRAPDPTVKISDMLPPSLIEFTIGEDHGHWDDSKDRPTHKPRFGFFMDFVRDRHWERTTPNLRIFNVLSEREVSEREDELALRDDHYPLPPGIRTPRSDVYVGEEEFKTLCSENGLTCEVFRLFTTADWLLFFFQTRYDIGQLWCEQRPRGV